MSCSPGSPTARAGWRGSSAHVAATGANLVDVSHVREGLDLHVRETAVELVLETRGQEHAAAIESALAKAGYEVQVVR